MLKRERGICKTEKAPQDYVIFSVAFFAAVCTKNFK